MSCIKRAKPLYFLAMNRLLRANVRSLRASLSLAGLLLRP
jgi:hypothetical protein